MRWHGWARSCSRWPKNAPARKGSRLMSFCDAAICAQNSKRQIASMGRMFWYWSSAYALEELQHLAAGIEAETAAKVLIL